MRTLLCCIATVTALLTGAATTHAKAATRTPTKRCSAKASAVSGVRCAATKPACRRGSAKRRRACRRAAAARDRARAKKSAAAKNAATRTPKPATKTSPPARTPWTSVSAGASRLSAPRDSATGSGSSPEASSGSSDRLFAVNSVWNASLKSNAPLDADSPTLMAAFNRQIKAEITAGIGPWISESSYSAPLYTVGAGQTRVTVKLDTGSWGATLQSALDDGVPIPSEARPAAGTDGHMTVYQPSTDTLWEFWHASKKADGWHASWGGVMRSVSRSPGYYTNASWPSLAASDGWHWGSTATSLPVIAGTIMIDELRRGRIDHALALAVPNACADRFTWPAQRTDGTAAASDCLPEGAHLRIDPSVDLSKRGHASGNEDPRGGRTAVRHHRARQDAEGDRVLRRGPHPERDEPVPGNDRPVRRPQALELPSAVPVGKASAPHDDGMHEGAVRARWVTAASARGRASA